MRAVHNGGSAFRTSFPHMRRVKIESINEDLADAFVCQYVGEQFQEMMRAKHLRKDLRLNLKLPEGQQVNEGASAYSVT